jgi:hypothetical protein
MRRTLCAVVLVLAMLGCARKGYVKPGASSQDFNGDYAQCEREIGYEGWCFGVGCLVAKGEIDGRVKRCLLAKGWSVEEGGYRP